MALARERSLQRAAAALGTSRARLRRKLEELEAIAGARLLTRSRQGVVATPAGRVLAAHADAVIEQASLLVSGVRQIGAEPHGVLRVAVQVGYPPRLPPAIFAAVRERHPLMRFEMFVAERALDLLPDQADAAVVVGTGEPDVPCRSFPLAIVRRGLFATPGYLAREGTPKRPTDLHEHAILLWRDPYAAHSDALELTRGGTLRVEPLLTSVDEQLLRACAASELGIAYIPGSIFPDEASEALVPVLPALVGASTSVRVVVPAVLADLPRIQALVALMRETTLAGPA